MAQAQIPLLPHSSLQRAAELLTTSGGPSPALLHVGTSQLKVGSICPSSDPIREGRHRVVQPGTSQSPTLGRANTSSPQSGVAGRGEQSDPTLLTASHLLLLLPRACPEPAHCRLSSEPALKCCCQKYQGAARLPQPPACPGLALPEGTGPFPKHCLPRPTFLEPSRLSCWHHSAWHCQAAPSQRVNSC